MISNGKVTDVQITSEGTGYSQNSEIRLVGGLSTALKPIRMELGKTLPLGIYAYDPDSMINPLGFVLDIKWGGNDTVITGSDPNFPSFGHRWCPEIMIFAYADLLWMEPRRLLPTWTSKYSTIREIR